MHLNSSDGRIGGKRGEKGSVCLGTVFLQITRLIRRAGASKGLPTHISLNGEKTFSVFQKAVLNFPVTVSIN